jgi:hypothetical protein
LQLFPDDAIPGEAISLGVPDGQPLSASAYLPVAIDTAAPAGTGEEPALPVAESRVWSGGVPYSQLPIRQRIALDAAMARQGTTLGPGGLKYEPSTINETDLQSLWRELGGIWRNIALVCNPFLKQEDVSAMLQHWDLWGPLVCHASFLHMHLVTRTLTSTFSRLTRTRNQLQRARTQE